MFKALTFILIVVNSGYAFAGHEVGNGGDLCENRILEIRDDIQSWIDLGGHQGLALPRGLTAAKYKATMSSAISKSVVSCTDKTIKVRGVEKQCVNLKRDGRKPSIVCNRKSFNGSSAREQYLLVHHEFAGIAGLETNKSEESEYEISNQLSSYLIVRKVAKLALEKRPVQPPNQIRKNFGDFIGNYKVLSFEEQMNEGKKENGTKLEVKFVEIYFSTQYFPPASGGEAEEDLMVVANYTNQLGVPNSMTFLARETSNEDTICTTYYGLQGCTSEMQGFVHTSSLKVIDGKIYLDETLNWPDPSKLYLFRRTTAVLEKIN